MDNKNPASAARNENSFFEEHFKTLDVNDINIDSNLLGKVGYKLSFAPYVILAAAAVVLLLSRHILAFVVAGILIFLSLNVIMNVKDYPTMDIYEDSIVIYTGETAEKAVVIYFDEIGEWSVQNDPYAAVKLVLNNGLPVYKNTFQTDKAFRYLNKAIPDKEVSSIMRKQVAEKKISISEFITRLIGRR